MKQVALRKGQNGSTKHFKMQSQTICKKEKGEQGQSHATRKYFFDEWGCEFSWSNFPEANKKQEWRSAMQVEFGALMKNKTW